MWQQKAALNRQAKKVAKLAGVSPRALAKLIIAADDTTKAAKAAKEKLAKLLGRLDADESLNAPIQVTADFAKTAQPPAAPAAAPAAPADAGAGPALPREPRAETRRPRWATPEPRWATRASET